MALFSFEFKKTKMAAPLSLKELREKGNYRSWLVKMWLTLLDGSKRRG